MEHNTGQSSDKKSNKENGCFVAISVFFLVILAMYRMLRGIGFAIYEPVLIHTVLILGVILPLLPIAFALWEKKHKNNIDK